MPAVVAAGAGEALLGAEVAAPLFEASASFIPAAGELAGLSAMEGMGGLGALGTGLGALNGLGGAMGPVGSGLGQLAGSGLAGVAPEAAAQIQSVQSAALPGANQIFSNPTIFQPTAPIPTLEASTVPPPPTQFSASAIAPNEPPVDLGFRPGQVSTTEPISLQETYPRGSSAERQALFGNTEGAYGLQGYDNRFAPLEKPSTSTFGGIGDLVQNAYGSAKKWIEENPKTAAAGAGLAGYMLGQRSGGDDAQKATPYNGPLSKLRYDPAYFKATAPVQPTPYQPVYQSYRPYAEGGAVMDGGSPGMQLQGNNDPLMFQSTGVERMAGGGLSDLGAYSDGGRMLKGPGDGMSDDIPATIAGKQPARLANDEFVVPADVVSHLGNGSSDAGAKQLYKMMDRVRQARTGNKNQGKQINPNKFMPA